MAADYATAAALIRLATAQLRVPAPTRRPVPHDPARTLPPAVLRSARLTVGLSQRELAREFPYGRSLIAEVERGKRSCPPDLAAWARRVLGSPAGRVPLSVEAGEDAVAGG